MIENIKRFREPTAWVILLVTVASMVLALVRFGAAVGSGSEGIRAASQDVANSAMNLTLVVLVVAMVGACLFVAPATPRAVGLTRAAALVVTAGTVLTVVATVVGVTASNAAGDQIEARAKAVIVATAYLSTSIHGSTDAMLAFGNSSVSRKNGEPRL